MPELVLQLTRAGFLALLWIFVLFSLRVVRSDLYGAAGCVRWSPAVAGPADAGVPGRPASSWSPRAR